MTYIGGRDRRSGYGGERRRPGTRGVLRRVDWLDTPDVDDAFWETGIYSSAITVTKLRNQYTLDRLDRYFDVEE